MRISTVFLSLALVVPALPAADSGHGAPSHNETTVHSQALFGHAPARDANDDMTARHSSSRAVLDNEGLVLLARAGYNERFLADLLKTRPAKLDTSVEGLVFMARQGISERLVRAILARERAEQAARDRESDETFDLSPAARSPGSTKPVRLRVVRHNVLVPANPSEAIAPGAVIVEEGGAFWAKPAAAGSM
jgi:hypothetical protein